MKYEDQLRHPKWLAFRKDVYKRARFRCQLCGKQNVGLEAHHSYYESDKMAWEYPIESVIALCNTCHSEKAHGKPSEELLLAQFETQHVRDQLQFSESLYKQFIAYIVATKLNGRIDISDKNFSPIGDDFVYQYSYDDETGTITISGTERVPYDGSVAYGIPISSRYDRESEIREMVNFVDAAQKADLAPYVTSLFYDTKSCCCTIELADGVDQFSPIADGILELARETIGQFDWFGAVEHGKPLTEF